MTIIGGIVADSVINFSLHDEESHAPITRVTIAPVYRREGWD